jgi:hypothetical protein
MRTKPHFYSKEYTNATTQDLLEAVFSVGPTQRPYTGNQNHKNVAPTQKDYRLLSSKRRPHFQTYKWNILLD